MTNVYSSGRQQKSWNTFEDGHVDVGADLGHMVEPLCDRLGPAALCWLQVIAAGLAEGRRGRRGRDQSHQGGEGQDEEDPQHGCSCQAEETTT